MQEVRRSFDRAKERGFARRFYDVLLAADPAIRAKFQATDFEQQRELLVHGVYSMLDYAEGASMGKLAMERLSLRHGPTGLNVSAAMFERWLSCFIEALAETDPQFDEKLTERWIDALRPALDRLSRPSSAALGSPRRAQRS